jgi:hypothetical protein
MRCEPRGLIGERRPKKPKDGHGDGPRRPTDNSNATSENTSSRPTQAAQAGCASNDRAGDGLIPF